MARILTCNLELAGSNPDRTILYRSCCFLEINNKNIIDWLHLWLYYNLLDAYFQFKWKASTNVKTVLYFMLCTQWNLRHLSTCRSFSCILASLSFESACTRRNISFISLCTCLNRGPGSLFPLAINSSKALFSFLDARSWPLTSDCRSCTKTSHYLYCLYDSVEDKSLKHLI